MQCTSELGFEEFRLDGGSECRGGFGAVPRAEWRKVPALR